jgi:hypothetical protein
MGASGHLVSPASATVFRGRARSPELNQGELIGPLFHSDAIVSASGTAEGSEVALRPVHHRMALVMTSDCDLYGDFHTRFPASGQAPPEPDLDPSTLFGINLLDVFPFKDLRELRPSVKSGDERKRIEKNQNERYHVIPGESRIRAVRDPICVDFRRSFNVPSSQLYDALSGDVKRIAWLASPFLFDLIHRYYGFLARIGVPQVNGP